MWVVNDSLLTYKWMYYQTRYIWSSGAKLTAYFDWLTREGSVMFWRPQKIATCCLVLFRPKIYESVVYVEDCKRQLQLERESITTINCGQKWSNSLILLLGCVGRIVLKFLLRCHLTFFYSKLKMWCHLRKQHNFFHIIQSVCCWIIFADKRRTENLKTTLLTHPQRDSIKIFFLPLVDAMEFRPQRDIVGIVE